MKPSRATTSSMHWTTLTSRSRSGSGLRRRLMKPYVWALQLEAWAKDARRSRGEEAPQPKLKERGAVDVDAVSFSERLDRLEADCNKRFDKLLKLHEASMVRPEAVVVNAPSAGVAEPSVAARNREQARLPQSSEHVAQPGSEAKASCHVSSKALVGCPLFVGGVVNQAICSVTAD